MSGGLNKEFLASPLLFMQRHVFNNGPDNSLNGVTGVTKINLVTGAYGLNRLPMATVTRAPAVRSTYSHAFDAYYLPWVQNEQSRMQLGTNADYFFTAGVTGCRLIIGTGTQPLLNHVDGGRYSDGEMDDLCSTKADGTNTQGQRYWDNGEEQFSVVVGIRQANGWVFYAQNYDYDSTLPIRAAQV